MQLRLQLTKLYGKLIFAKKNLKGVKVKVKDINNLTPLEAQQILNLMRQAYNSDKNYPMVEVYQKWHTSQAIIQQKVGKVTKRQDIT